MNSLFLQTPSANINCSFTSTGTQVLDSVTKSFLEIDDWVAQEINRIMHNQLPRNCTSYEALLSVIEELEQYNTICMNDKNLNDTCKKKEKQKAEEKKEEEEGTFITEQTPFTKSSYQFTQKSLVVAFIKLIHYCEKEKLHYYLQHHRTPLELLLELEKMCEVLTKDVDIKSITHTQESLTNILFGERVPISNLLLESWFIISTWVQQGQQFIKDKVEVEQWLTLGISSYQTAKRVCGF